MPDIRRENRKHKGRNVIPPASGGDRTMAQKSGNKVKPPVKDDHGMDQSGKPNLKNDLADQHHGESTKPLEADKRIGQHNGAGRPPLMKK
jgi:hypothetical protein